MNIMNNSFSSIASTLHTIEINIYHLISVCNIIKKKNDIQEE